MKKSKKDDSVAKAFQERYASVLGLESFSGVETPTKSLLRRYVFFLMLLGLAAISAWFYFRPPSADTTPSAASISSINPQQVPASSPDLGLPAKSVAEQPEPVVPEHAEPEAMAGESASYDKSNDSDSAQNQHPLSAPLPSTPTDTLQPAVSGSSFVVLLSTRSKDEAIARARELGNSGNPCEVILSSSDYYGVVLRRDTYEQAQAAMKAIIAAGVVKTAPYIMSASRVKEHIYPGVQ
jgi:hypothetical protein